MSVKLCRDYESAKAADAVRQQKTVGSNFQILSSAVSEWTKGK